MRKFFTALLVAALAVVGLTAVTAGPALAGPAVAAVHAAPVAPVRPGNRYGGYDVTFSCTHAEGGNPYNIQVVWTVWNLDYDSTRGQLNSQYVSWTTSPHFKADKIALEVETTPNNYSVVDSVGGTVATQNDVATSGEGNLYGSALYQNTQTPSIKVHVYGVGSGSAVTECTDTHAL